MTSSVMGAMDVFPYGSEVIIEDVIESVGEGADCNVSVYQSNSRILLERMDRSDLAYNYSLGDELCIDTYVCIIECNLSNNSFLGVCDFEVTGDKKMWNAIVLALLGMTALFFVGAVIIKDSRLKMMKGILFLLALVNTLFLGMLPFLISLNPHDSSTFNPVGVGFLSVNGILIVFFIWIYALHLIGRAFDMTKYSDKEKN